MATLLWTDRHRKKGFLVLLAIDVGNTNVTVGVFEDDRLCSTWRFSPDVSRSADEYGILVTTLLEHGGIDPSAIKDAVIGSVVHGLEATIEEACRRYFKTLPLVVGTGVKTGLRILYDSPREVGVDRVADAVAAVHAYGTPLIIVDLGTATVFDAISREGDYIGGSIAPGLGVSAEALFQRASKLYRVELEAPRSVIGRNTVSSMQSGIILGHVSLIEGMVSRFKEELGADAQVIATGGFGELIAKLTHVIDHLDLDLTLAGLRIIYGLNRG
jgi:type III pantothenate kinase